MTMIDIHKTPAIPVVWNQGHTVEMAGDIYLCCAFEDGNNLYLVRLSDGTIFSEWSDLYPVSTTLEVR